MSTIDAVQGTGVLWAAFSSDPGAELAALAVTTGQVQQDGARAARDADERTEAEQDDQQVAAMHAKADDIRDAGIVDGLGAIAGGVADLGGAIGSISAPSDAAGRARMAIGSGVGKLVEGSSKVGSSSFGADGANRDADAAAHKASADQAKQAADDMQDAKKSAGDYVSAALDFYREYTSTQSQTSGAALHRA